MRLFPESTAGSTEPHGEPPKADFGLRRANLALDPLAAIQRWPAEEPLIGLCSGWGNTVARDGSMSVMGKDQPPGWTILARPSGPAVEAAFPPGAPTPATESARGAGAPGMTAGVEVPFAGGWIGWLSYELGEAWEPAAARPGDPRPKPAMLARWHRCNDALLFDHDKGEWWAIGDPPVDALSAARQIPSPGFHVGPLRSLMGRERYTRAVARAIEYIRAGDVYQVNISHELDGAFSGSTRAAFAAMARGAAPTFGAYIEERLSGLAEDPRRLAILSASPEMFLSYSPSSRRLVTRPMKGTRPGGASAAELAGAEKDRAELNMIIDLMRNDLGKVCEFGSVHVERAREIERHGTGGAAGHPGDILQATGTISGIVRTGVDIRAVMRAVFPGGSITGAPKVRAMQIIAELEPVRRAIYCGSIGYISDCGRAQFNIAIRTARVEGLPSSGGPEFIDGGRLSYSVGAGIVADSTPEEEWQETLVKAGPMRGIAAIDER